MSNGGYSSGGPSPITAAEFSLPENLYPQVGLSAIGVVPATGAVSSAWTPPNFASASSGAASQASGVASATPYVASGNAAATDASLTDWASAWALRATIIVLGFIFVAVGLRMFRADG